MPAQTGKSVLMQKYGARAKKALDVFKTKPPVDRGFQRLPPGIRDGVAQLREAVIGVVEKGKRNEGEPYFRAMAVMMDPESVVHEGQNCPVRGGQTSQFEMLCDTKSTKGVVTTLEEHLDKVQNMLRLIDPTLDVSDLDAAVVEIQERQPYFRVTTSVKEGGGIDPKTKKPYPPGVWENWHEGKDGYQPPEDGVEDAEAPPPTEAAAAAETGNGEAAPPDDTDMEGLVEAATAKDKDAQERLTNLAKESGVSEEDILNADTWADLAAMIEAASAPGGDESAAEDEDEEGNKPPAKGDLCHYRVLDSKGKPVIDKKTGRKKKPVECEVVSVNVKAETVTLKNKDDGKTLYKEVEWSDLEE